MRKTKFYLVVAGLLSVFLMILSACSSSTGNHANTNYLQGEWKVQTANGQNSTITFDKDSVTVGEKKFAYKQKSVKTKKGLTYYKIEQNGEDYSVIFPEKDKNIAIMIQPTSTKDDLYGTMLYAMNKKKQPNYKQYAQKYMNTKQSPNV